MSGSGSNSRRVALLFAAALPFLACARVAPAADPEAVRNKAQVCAVCHGANGNSASPAVPTLAGQPAQFIATQLVMFREGNRKDPQMSPAAANMVNTDINALAAYFSAQPLVPTARVADPAQAVTARRLTEQYHCVSCHGPALKGQQHIPRLAGQQFEYLRTQLRGFRASTRFDMDGNMTSAVQGLTDADVEILADYLSSLQ